MKIKWNNDAIRRVINDGSCAKCWFKNNTASCNPDLINLCTTENSYYMLYPYKSNDSIFFI